MKFWRRNSAITHSIASFMTMWMMIMPGVMTFTQAYADQLTQEAKKGQDTGANFLLNYSPPTVNDGMSPVDPADYLDGGGNLINEIYSRELFPGYNPYDTTSQDALEALGENPEDLTTQGFGQSLTLGSGTDENSLAYQALDDSAANPNDYDLRTDDFLDVTREIVSGDATILDEILTGCTDQVTAGSADPDVTTHLADIWTCSQAPVGAPDTCTVERDFTLVPIETRTVYTAAVAGASPYCGAGLDVDHWGPRGWSAHDLQSNGASLCASSSATAPTNDYYGQATVDLGLGPSANWLSSKFCGDFGGAAPTATACDATARYHEHLCRAGVTNPNPARGGYGTCSGPEPGSPDLFNDPVDYTGCDVDRIEYCRGVRQEFQEECKNDCDQVGAEHWSLFQGAPNTSGGLCQVRDQSAFFPDFSAYPSFEGLSIFYQYEWIPGEPGIDERRVWADYYCGTHAGRTPAEIEQACLTSANDFEIQCRNTVGNGPGAPIGWITSMNVTGGGSGNCSPFQESGAPPFTYSGCPSGREDSCIVLRERHFEACLGESPPPTLMNGTETLTGAAIGTGGESTEAIYGTSVSVTQDPIEPTAHGLIAGQYVIASHLVSGSDVVDSAINYGGSYSTNWDYDFTATVVDASEFSVQATLYEIQSNGFTFTGCEQGDVENLTSGFCAGSMTCTDYTPPCRIVDGVEVCEATSPTDGIAEVLSPWNDFANGIPEMCWAADVEITDCTIAHDCFTSGECVNDCGDLPPELQPACEAPPCWIDANGVEICLDNTAENWVDNLGDAGFVDDCAELLARPECALLPEVTCVEGMEDPLDPLNINSCQLRKRFFDCGYDVTYPGNPGDEQVDTTCEAEIRCLGDECTNTVQESNPDFVRAATATTVINEFQKDVSCSIEGDPSSCVIFEGADSRCKEPRGSYLGIIPDCCKEAREAGAVAGDFTQYMQLAAYSWRLAQDPIVAQYMSGLAGSSALEGVSNGVGALQRASSSVGSAISNGFNSALQWAGFSPAETASNAVDVATDLGSSATGFGPIQQFIATGVNNFLDTVGLDALGDSLFSTTSEGLVTDWASSGLGQMVGSALSVIGLIYTVYNILKLLGSIFFACEEEELAFGIQLNNRACHYVGDYCSKKVTLGVLGGSKCVIETQTYCCFSSPLPRIINEQVRLQGIGPDWGTAKAPNCDGIPISELENVDWSLVDLSEWEAIMFEAGLVPNPGSPPLNFIPTERHPGDSSGGSNDGVDSVSTNIDTINTIAPDGDEARFLLDSEPFAQPDSELMPWYCTGSGC